MFPAFEKYTGLHKMGFTILISNKSCLQSQIQLALHRPKAQGLTKRLQKIARLRNSMDGLADEEEATRLGSMSDGTHLEEQL